MSALTRYIRSERTEATDDTEQPQGSPGDAAHPDGGAPVTRWRDIPRAAWAVHLASLLVGGLYLLKLDHRMWFYFDEWDFIGSRGLSHSALGVLTPHNEHWVTLPILLYRALLSVFGLYHYWVFAAVLIAAHLAVAHMAWRLSMRVGARPLVATVLAGIFVLLGAGGQNLVWAFQVSFVGSVLFGLLWLWIADHGGPFGRRDMAGWAAGVAALMCSAIGVPMLMVAAVAVGLRRGVRQAALVISVPLGVFAVWYLAFGRDAQQQAPVNKGTLLQVASYAWGGIDSALSDAVGFAGAGAVLAVALLYALLRRPSDPQRRDAVARAGAVGVVLTYLFIGIGRAGLGTAQADRSRYAYVAIALLLPAAALLLSALFRPALGPVLVFGLLAAVVLIANVQLVRVMANTEITKATVARRQILASYDVVNGPGYTFPSSQTALYTGPQPSVANLRQIRRNGWLGPHYKESPGMILGARARLQVGVLPAGAAAPATVPAVISEVRALSVTSAGPGCIVATPQPGTTQLILGPSRLPQLLTLSRGASWQLAGELGLPGRTLVRQLPGLAMPPSGRLLVGAPGVRTALTLPAGPTRVCGLDPAAAAAAARSSRSAARTTAQGGDRPAGRPAGTGAGAAGNG